MPGGTRDGKGRYSRTIDTARRDAEAAALRASGRTFDQIAAELRFSSRAKAYEAVQRAYADIPYEGVEEARRLDLERIDRLIGHCWAVMLREHLTISQGRIVGKRVGWERDEATGEVLRDGDGAPVPVYEDILDDGPGMTAVREIRGLLERRARITGYDAPARSRIEVVTPETVEAHIAALPSDEAEDAKRLDLERIDRLIARAWDVMERAHVAWSNGQVVRRRTGEYELDGEGFERLDDKGNRIPLYEEVLDDGPLLSAIDRIERLIGRRARIFGYEAPARSRIEVVTPDMIESKIAELEAQLAVNDPAGRA